MAISADRWDLIEKELKGDFGRVTIQVDLLRLDIMRVPYSEGVRKLCVYFDGKWNPGWGWPDSDKYRPIAEEVWRRRSTAVYTKAQRTELIKACGGIRKARAAFGNLEKKIVCYEPFFQKASTLCRQLKRIDDERLILISVGYCA